MYCSGCGQEVMGGARFCPRCGRAMQVPAPGTWDGLIRPRSGRKIAGVCAAFALRYGWDVSVVRVLTVIFTLFSCCGVGIAYLVAWVALPEEPLYLPAPVAAAPHSADSAG